MDWQVRKVLKHKNVEAQRWSDRQASLSNKSSIGSIDMNIVHNNELTFQNINFAYMEMAGQIWLTLLRLVRLLSTLTTKLSTASLIVTRMSSPVK